MLNKHLQQLLQRYPDNLVVCTERDASGIFDILKDTYFHVELVKSKIYGDYESSTANDAFPILALTPLGR